MHNFQLFIFSVSTKLGGIISSSDLLLSAIHLDLIHISLWYRGQMLYLLVYLAMFPQGWGCLENIWKLSKLNKVLKLEKQPLRVSPWFRGNSKCGSNIWTIRTRRRTMFYVLKLLLIFNYRQVSSSNVWALLCMLPLVFAASFTLYPVDSLETVGNSYLITNYVLEIQVSILAYMP